MNVLKIDLVDKDIKMMAFKMLKQLNENVEKVKKQCINKMEISRGKKPKKT